MFSFCPDATGMGGKQSFLSQSATLENIQAAYAAGDNGKAQELIKISCSESAEGRPEKVRGMSFSLLEIVGGRGGLKGDVNCC